MVFSSPGEQHIDFRVHNSYWKPVDYDGIKLMLRPLQNTEFQQPIQPGFGKASSNIYLKRNIPLAFSKGEYSMFFANSYVVLDFETTGLDSERGRIIEIGALLITNGRIEDRYDSLINIDYPIPDEIVSLTGITNDILHKNGTFLECAIENLRDFVEDYPIVCHNADFEASFFSSACRILKEDGFTNKMIDTLEFCKKLEAGVDCFKLKDIADRLGIEVVSSHRAVTDCETTMKVYEKLKNTVNETFEK